MPRNLFTALLLAAVLALAACGGDSSSGKAGGDSTSIEPGGPMPDLVGMKWVDATDKLALAGIPYISKGKPGTESTTPLRGDQQEVCETTPKAGDPIPSDVTMIIAPLGKC